jgi:uncharacterized protein YprB with RNaseH-like and TPR domain
LKVEFKQLKDPTAPFDSSPPRQEKVFTDAFFQLLNDYDQSNALVAKTGFYKPNIRYGNAYLRTEEPLQRVKSWMGLLPHQPLSPERLLFLDTETTGLLDKEDAYVFLVGLGFYEENGFRLLQFFLTEPEEEIALLQVLSRCLGHWDGIVTFNGLGFDLPMLQRRYEKHGLTFPLETPPQLDLLPLARCLWRPRLRRRGLRSLEENILNIQRQEDLEGALLPARYEAYLQDRDLIPLWGAFEHNALDVLAMAGLLSRMATLLNVEEPDELYYAEDRLGMGDFLVRVGEKHKALEFMKAGLHDELAERWQVCYSERIEQLQQELTTRPPMPSLSR